MTSTEVLAVLCKTRSMETDEHQNLLTINDPDPDEIEDDDED